MHRTVPVPGYEENISNFHKEIVELNCDGRIWGLNVTNKMHIIFSHVQEYIELTGHGLSAFSDQGVEAMHQKLASVLEKSHYVLKLKDCVMHAEKLPRDRILNWLNIKFIFF